MALNLFGRWWAGASLVINNYGYEPIWRNSIPISTNQRRPWNNFGTRTKNASWSLPWRSTRIKPTQYKWPAPTFQVGRHRMLPKSGSAPWTRRSKDKEDSWIPMMKREFVRLWWMHMRWRLSNDGFNRSSTVWTWETTAKQPVPPDLNNGSYSCHCQKVWCHWLLLHVWQQYFLSRMLKLFTNLELF